MPSQCLYDSITSEAELPINPQTSLPPCGRLGPVKGVSVDNYADLIRAVLHWFDVDVHGAQSDLGRPFERTRGEWSPENNSAGVNVTTMQVENC